MLYEKLMANGRVAVPDIYFDVGRATLRPESMPSLAAISALLQENSALRVCVEAHTDSIGSAAHNQLLSEARAAAVVAYLTSRGIDAARLTAAGRGSAEPVAPNDTPENRQRNRRIELVLHTELLAQ